MNDINYTRYDIKESACEKRKKNDIIEGCSIQQEDSDDWIIKSFDNKDNAIKELLEQYKTKITYMSGNVFSYYVVTEYYVEENVYNDDEEWIGGGDIIKVTPMKI